MMLQYPISVHDPLIQPKLDRLDAISCTLPKNQLIDVTINVHQKFMVHSKLVWYDHRAFLADYMALYVFCHDTIKEGFKSD